MLDDRHLHAEHHAEVAIVQMEEVVSGALAFENLHAEADVERFFAGTTYPEVGFTGLRHFDAAFFEPATEAHQAMVFAATMESQRFAATEQLLRRGKYPAVGAADRWRHRWDLRAGE